MTNFNEFKEKMFENPEVKEEYDALEPEFDIIQAMVKARKQLHLTIIRKNRNYPGRYQQN